MPEEFWGFQREDGRVGVRNNLAVISAMDTVNPIAARVADMVDGAVLVSDLFGRKLGGHNHRVRQRTLTGMGKNPNVGAVILVSLHHPSADPLAEEIAKSGKDVEVIAFQDFGSSLICLEKGLRLAVKMVKKLTSEKRAPFPLSDLALGVECGGSDFSSGIAGNPAVGRAADKLLAAGGTVILSETPEIIGAEHILSRRAVNEEVSRKIVDTVARMEQLAEQAGFENIRASNPSADNKRGGLSTLAEKSLGAILKAGTRPLDGVLKYGEPRPKASGFYFMDTPAPACESMTGLAAGGVQVIAFNTGLGNPIASPVAPTLKVSGNPLTVEKSSDDLDVEVSDMITQGLSVEEAGNRVFSELIETASGKATFSELLKITQSTVRVLGPSV